MTTQQEADRFTDNQLKSIFFGEFLMNSLTEPAKRRLRPYKIHYEVVSLEGHTVIDGPTLLFYITKLVDSDNGHLVDEVNTKLRKLHIKDYGYSAQKLMAEFQNLIENIDNLGGDYSTDEKFLDFWASLKTMKEPEFLRFVKQEQDNYRKQPRGSRSPIEEIMTIISDKEIAMRADNEWNTPSETQSQIMALYSMLNLHPNQLQAISQTNKRRQAKNLLQKTSAQHGRQYLLLKMIRQPRLSTKRIIIGVPNAGMVKDCGLLIQRINTKAILQNQHWIPRTRKRNLLSQTPRLLFLTKMMTLALKCRSIAKCSKMLALV